MSVQEPNLLSVQEFANRVNRTQRAIYKAIKTGRIKALRTEDGGAFQIPESEVQNYGSVTAEPVQEPSVEPVQESLNSTNPDLARVQELVQQSFLGALERANEEIRRVERQKVELELQLRLHRNLLTENAESLMEHKAESLGHQEKASELAKRVEELERANAELVEEQKRSWWSKIWNKKRTTEVNSQTA